MCKLWFHLGQSSPSMSQLTPQTTLGYITIYHLARVYLDRDVNVVFTCSVCQQSLESTLPTTLGVHLFNAALAVTGMYLRGKSRFTSFPIMLI